MLLYALGTFATVGVSAAGIAVNVNAHAVTLISGTGYVGLSAGTLDDDLVLAPNGSGAIQAAIADSTTAGGNVRGSNAVDWQTAARTAATQVASGVYSTCSGGRRNTANGAHAVSAGGFLNTASASTSTVGGGGNNVASATSTTVGGGDTNTASQTYATVGGGQLNTASGAHSSVLGGNANTATGIGATSAGGTGAVSAGDYSYAQGFDPRATASHSHAIGRQSLADHWGECVQASGQFSARGDAQRGDVGMRTATSDATPKVLTLDGAVESAANRMLVAAGVGYTFRISGQASQINIGGTGVIGDTRWFTITGCIKNVGGTLSFVGALVPTSDGDASTATWTLVATPNSTNDCLDITFTGEANKSIRINVTVRYDKLNFA